MTTARQQRRLDLFDHAVAHPAGFTKADAALALGWDLDILNRTIRDLRHSLGAEDTPYNLVADHPGDRGQWRYRLVDTRDDGRGWLLNRKRDAQARLETVHSVIHSLVEATDGRTHDGRVLVRCEQRVQALRDDLALVDL